MLARVRELIEREGLLERGERVVAAVSGGADSTALLDVLCRLQPELDLALHVAHLDHALRPGSEEDAAFVAERAAARGLGCTVERRDVRAWARRHKTSLEAAARSVRYDFLRSVASQQGAERIALGHTRDDQAETFLLNLLRGAGPGGLKGMRPRSGPFVRPLLDRTRAEVRAYLSERGLTFREDPSNRDRRFRRNWVRHELVPLLERVNPNLVGTLAREQGILGQIGDYLNQQARAAFEALLRGQSEQSVTLDRAGFNEAHPALRAELVRLGYAAVRGGADGLTAERVRAALSAAGAEASGQRVELHGGVALWVEPDALRFTARTAQAEAAPPVALPVPGAVRWNGWRLRARVCDWPQPAPTNDERLAVWLAWGKIDPPLRVRGRRRGDRIDPLGLRGHKKIQDVLVDAKIPRSERDRVPLVLDQGGILWAVGCCLSERAKRDTDSARVLEIVAEREHV